MRSEISKASTWACRSEPMRQEHPGVRGRAHPPGRSVSLPMRLERRGDRIVLIEDGRTVWRDVLADDVKLDPPLGRTARRVTFADGTLFETEESARVEEIIGGRRSFWNRLHGAETFSPRLVGVVLAAFVGIYLVYRYGLELVVAVAVWLTPPILLQTIDSGTMQTMDVVLFEPSELSADDQARLTEMHGELVALLPEDDVTPFEHRLLFRDAPGMGPNAMALPGGTVVVTDALVKEFDDPDLHAGVIGHEIAHVTEKHGLTALYRSIGIYVAVALIAGDTGPILEDVLLEGNVLLSLSHSRAAEREADQVGVELAMEAGYDPEGLIRFFEWVDEYGGDGGFYSTHPGGLERADAIRELRDQR
ncbi:M48 family metallopeptidase [Aestuariibius sp. 2305UL40-4]|uniref:M48 family metallopeptidase n=1 Tax=Aestuariibius violaceus TaxID=3234132 RepID=UPI003480ECAA